MRSRRYKLFLISNLHLPFIPTIDSSNRPIQLSNSTPKQSSIPTTINDIIMSQPALPTRASIASRSADAPAVLIRPCCLRCSKHLASQPDLRCRKLNNRSVCERCRRLNKPCHAVSTDIGFRFVDVNAE